MEPTPLATNAGLWTVVPPVLAILLALRTKEVIFSLFVGILAGLGIYTAHAHLSAAQFPVTLVSLVQGSMGDGDHLAVLVFAFFMGPLIAVMTRSGGANAFGKWAVANLKTAVGAQVATVVFGLLFFVDDYFNCLTIGNVMRPVTDKFRISREKLAYFVDATAAPICVIAPITTWAAYIVSIYADNVPGVPGMTAFLRAIPFNLYSILSVVMVLWLAVRRGGDFGPMAAAEARARAGDPAGAAASDAHDEALAPAVVSARGRVWDLAVPVVVLVASGIALMLYLGGYWKAPAEGEAPVSVFAAIGDTQAALAFATACLIGLAVAFALVVPRGVISYKEFFACIPAGIRMMVSALIILVLAWTLSTICNGLLGIDDFISDAVKRGADSGLLPLGLLPAVLFLLAAVIAFSTGTSWGTFGILIPIAIAVCNKVDPSLNALVLSSILSGSVMGDHCSPISDTTILSSTGAQCRHIDHVRTQLPYALTVGATSAVGYVVAGATRSMAYGVSACITLAVSAALLVAALLVLPRAFPGTGKARKQAA
ncbi:MAG: Na+/H+ antiporter NhaC family protein [Kiritimatiellae bacterium]|nr:Na+/H+ antiporter NhaC family protein [Kiritimatiellia bacterium]